MPANRIKLRGIAVGDGCMGTDVPGCGGEQTGNTWRNVQFFYGHGQVSTKLYTEIVATCTQAALEDGSFAARPGCEPLISKMWDAIGGYYA